MKRMPHYGALLGVLTLLVLGSTSAPGMLPEQERVPANALMAVGIADTAGMWGKTDALALTQAITQYLNGPQMAANLDYQQFQLDRRKLEATLGYPATPEEFLRNVFRSALIYGVPATDPQGQPAMAAILGVRDPAKAARLVEALDKRNQEAMAAAGAAVTTATAPAAIFEKVTFGKTAVSHVRGRSPGGEMRDGYYALAGDRFYFSSDAAAMERLVQEQDKPDQALDQNPTFSQLSGALPWKEADVTGWLDSAALLAANGNPLVGMMSRMGQSEKIAFALEVERDGIVGQVASTAEPGGQKPRRLAGVGFLPAAPLAAMVYGQFDAEKSLQQFQGMLSMMSMAGQMSGKPGAGSVKNPLEELEQSTGISVQNELLPALGHELTFSINSLRMGFDPQGMAVDLMLGVEVRDGAKMKLVMDKLERYIESRLGGMSAMSAGPGGAAGPARFQTIAGAVPIRTLNTGNPMINPSYAIAGQYLLFSINSASIQGALARGAGQQPSAAASPLFAEMRTITGTDEILGYSVADVRQVSQTVLLPFLSLAMLSGNAKFSPAQQQQAMALVTQILPQVGTAVSVETLRDGLAQGYFKLKM